MPNLLIRVISALIVAPFALAMIWIGGWPFNVFVIIGGLLVIYEWRGITKIGDLSFFSSAISLVVSAILCVLGHFLYSIAIIVGVAFALFFFADRARQSKSLWSGLGGIYAAAPVFALILLRSDPVSGLFAVAFVMIVVWVTDIAAYGVGRTIGGPKLWPAVSPNKTWAGLIGGAGGAAIAAWIISMFITGATAWELALLGAFLAIVSQGGDLAESALKRHFGVKDSGALFPGHGGILDRVDGLIAAAIVAAVFGVLHSSFEHAGTGLLY